MRHFYINNHAKSIPKQLISIFLVIITILSCFPNAVLKAEATSGGSSYNGSTKSVSYGGSGTFSVSRTGIRVYVIDRAGNRVSNIADIANKPTMGADLDCVIGDSGRTEPLKFHNKELPAGHELYQMNVEGPLQHWIANPSDIEVESYQINYSLTENGPLDQTATITPDYHKLSPIIDNNFKARGLAIGKYFTGEKQLKPALAQLNGGGSGDATTDISDTFNSIPQESVNIAGTLAEQLDLIENKLTTNYNIFKQQYEKGAISQIKVKDMIIQEADSLIKEIIESNQFEEVEIKVIDAKIQQILSNIEIDLSKDGAEGKQEKQEKAKDSLQVSKESSFFDTAYATPESTQWDAWTLVNSLYDEAYAVEGEAKNLKPIYRDEKLTALLSARWYGVDLFYIEYKNPVYTSSGKLDHIQSLAKNDYIVMMEPIMWNRPNPTKGAAAEFLFYGTPHEYGQFLLMVRKQGFQQNDTGGNIGIGTHKQVPWAMYTDNDLVLSNMTIKAGATSGLVDKILTDTQMADATIGHSLHFYEFSLKPGDPEIPTYDITLEKTPGPAPDPDPNKPDEPKIPLTPSEDPVKYPELTRNVNIVKTYQIEHLDGSIEHVETFTRTNTPQTIHIWQEPEYKVVEWFTSTDYYFGLHPGEPVGPTEWDIMKAIDPATDGGETTYEESSTIPVAKSVFPDAKISAACDCDKSTNPDTIDGEHGKHAHDTTLYVRLIKKEKIPETSTWDEPDYPVQPGKQPYVKPHTSEDPKPPNKVNDPETTPGKKEDPFVHYRIVKVYETEYQDTDGNTDHLETDYIGTMYETNTIVHIQDEGQAPSNPSLPDLSWHLVEWQSSDYFKGEKWSKQGGNPNGTDWEAIKAEGSPVIQSGTTEAIVDLRGDKSGKDNKEEIVTLYVRLLRIIKPPVVTGDIIIQQSQISKTIHTNDKHIGGIFGNYRFAMTIGNYATTHISYYHDYCCARTKYHDCGKCHGHTCKMNMPGNWGDDKVTFNFDQTTNQDVLEVKTGVNSNTDPKVYGKSGSSQTRGTGISYPKTVNTLFAADNKYYFNSDGRSATGAEYVTVLWRGANGANNRSDPASPSPNDIPTLALFKKKDIEQHYGNDNYKIPYDMITKNGGKSDKISHKQRMVTDWVGDLEFSFGVHSRSDLKATSSCSNIGNYKGGCVHTQTMSYYAIESTKLVWGAAKQDDFYATVAIRFYAGKSKSPQTAPLGSPEATSLEIPTGTHKENNIIQCKQFINFYPYIRMTYMVNSLDDAIKEEQNIEQNGYTQDVRKDTYVLSEYESSVLPADAVEIGWNNSDEKNSISLISQQWSVHQKAINGSDGWQGRNQVLPGGAIFQVSTPEGKRTKVNIATYQTVVDQKAREEYLSSTLSGDEYTEERVAKDHIDLINDAKEVLDNLKIVQWVCNNVAGQSSSGGMTWPSNFDETPSTDGSVCLRGLGENISELRAGNRNTANTEDKYYLRANQYINQSGQTVGKLNDYQKDDTLLGDRTYEERGKHSNGSNPDTANMGDLDIIKINQGTTVFKLFTDTSGNVYLASVKKEGQNHINNTEADIKSMVDSLKDLNADTYEMGQTYGATIVKLCDKKVTGAQINSILPAGSDAKEIDDRTKFITNFVSALTRNKGNDKTAEWANKPDGKWYNEAFDGVYLVRQATSMEIGLMYSPIRVAALDPALCPPNRGQSDLYSKAFLSQFCLDSQSDATIAEGKAKNYIGTFKGTDLTMPDMESMYISRKFYIPNVNVQDLN